MNEKARTALGQWAVIVLALLTLEVLVRARVVSPIFLSSPWDTLATLWSGLINGKFVAITLITLYETGLTLLIGCFVGLLIGYSLWRYSRVGQAYEVLLGAIFASPTILLYPIALVIFGRTTSAIVTIGALFGLIPIAINTRSALAHVSPTLIKVGVSMNLSDREILRHILIPAAAPTIFSGFRLGLTYMLKAILAIEFIVQMGGLGKLTSSAYFRLDTPELYAGVLAIVLISVGLLYILYRGENWLRK